MKSTKPGWWNNWWEQRSSGRSSIVGEGSKTSTATGAETLSTTTTKADETLPSMGETALVNEATSLLRSLRAEASESLWTDDASTE